MSQTAVFYFLFLALVALVYYQLRSSKWQNIWLLCCSYLFYASWQPLFCVLLCCATAFTYASGLFIARKKHQQQNTYLGGLVAILLLPLFFFKYYNSVQGMLQQWAGHLHLSWQFAPQPWVVPLGISFFTFVAISYLVDINRGYLQPSTQPLRFATFLSFFPTIMAGPIERGKNLLPQLNKRHAFAYENVQAAGQLILWGLFKKIVIANRLNYFINGMYDQPAAQPGLFIYLAILLSSIQIFCDFSAYSDIAVGAARLLGIQVSKNFYDRVYAAPSREIFWQGWHRSLTAWLRDYVFFPLSKGVKAKSLLYVNLVIVYLLVGLWHGASWGFIGWGLLNGCWLVAENATKKWRQRFFPSIGLPTNGRLYNFLGWLLVYHVGGILGVFFRVDNWQQLSTFFKSLGNSNEGWNLNYYYPILMGGLLFTLVLDLASRQIPANKNVDAAFTNKPTWVRWIIYVFLSLLTLRFFQVYSETSFLYYNF